MTDFFSELDRHLSDAARRQARLGRFATAPLPRRSTVMAVAATAPAVALAIAFVPALVRDTEREQPAVTPAPAVLECAQDAPPERLLERFEVLRRPQTRQDVLPPRVLRWLAGEDGIVPVWNDHGRLGRLEGRDEYWVIPVAIGDTCGADDPAPAPGVCIAARSVVACAPVDVVVKEGLRINDGPTFLGNALTGGERARFEFLVPDGARPAVDVGRQMVRADVQGNVAIVTVADTAEQLDDAEVVVYSERASEPPATCAPGPMGVHEELAERLAVLRRGQEPGDRPSRDDLRRLSAGTNVPDPRFEDFLSVTLQMEPYLDGIRRLGAVGERTAYLIPVARRDSKECGVERDSPGRPGLCVTVLGAREPSGGFCTTAADVAAAKAVREDGRGRVVALVPDGVRAVRIEWRDGRPPSEIPVTGNLAFAQVSDAPVYTALQEARVTFVR